jgi:hypothetical protein
MLANTTMLSFMISKYRGSTTVMTCFLSTVLYVRNVWTFSSKICLATLIWAVVPAVITSGTHPGVAGFSHGWSGAKITYYAVNTSDKAGAQIPHLPLGDNSSPWGDNAVCM